MLFEEILSYNINAVFYIHFIVVKYLDKHLDN